MGQVAIPKLLPLLKDSDPKVRLSSAQALGYMGKIAKSTVPQLTPLLQDPDPDVSSGVAEALEKLREQL
jgi:HEAT repeat protein